MNINEDSFLASFKEIGNRSFKTIYINFSKDVRKIFENYKIEIIDYDKVFKDKTTIYLIDSKDEIKHSITLNKGLKNAIVNGLQELANKIKKHEKA